MAEQADTTQNLRDLKDKAADYSSSSMDAMKEQASDLADAAKDAGSQAAERLREEANTQKNAGAQYASGVAEAMRRAAREFDKDLPIAGTYLRRAASQVEELSDRVKSGDLNELLRDAQDFARRRPTVFLGLAVLAGFGAVRFLKSSAEYSPDEALWNRNERDRAERGREQTSFQGY
jgi:ABC-type transporter Mla subunit MlaD